MINVIAIFLVLIFLLLVAFGVAGFLAWQKISLFISFNTRYNSSEYEKAVMATGKLPRPKLPPLPAKKSVSVPGRAPKEIDEMVDLSDLGFEKGYDVVSKIGELDSGA